MFFKLKGGVRTRGHEEAVAKEIKMTGTIAWIQKAQELMKWHQLIEAMIKA